jgi:hypothetical protein
VGKLKSGALVPTASGINNPPVESIRGEIHYKIDIGSVKIFAEELTTDYTDLSDKTETESSLNPFYPCHPWFFSLVRGVLI